MGVCFCLAKNLEHNCINACPPVALSFTSLLYKELQCIKIITSHNHVNKTPLCSRQNACISPINMGMKSYMGRGRILSTEQSRTSHFTQFLNNSLSKLTSIILMLEK